ncbi:MAG: hypothetical protein DHS20C01_31300 [marine bacterium B5-7]|nr:MAG: hypothetical protein DHS20C01_31300 [marine bacterium B5-7]
MTMTFRIRYKPLCNVTFRHGYHLNDGNIEYDDLTLDKQQRKLAGFNLSEELRLFVPPETRRVLAGLGCLVKKTRTGFTVGVEIADPESKGPFVPARVPDRAFQLRFVLRARQPLFWNYTNLELRPRDQAIYYVSNRAGEVGGQFPDLSSPPSDFAVGTTYRAGDVVRTSPSADARYLAVRSGQHSSPTEGDLNWHKLGQHNYVGGTDRVLLRPLVFLHHVPEGTTMLHRIELIARDGTVHEVEFAVTLSGQTIDEISIDASQIHSGRYTLKLHGANVEGNTFEHSEPIYLDPALPAEDIFAIVELFHLPDGLLGDFRLYDEAADFALRQPEFIVRLLNRHTYWRYRFRVAPDPGTELGDLEKVGEQYVTRRVMPLTLGFQKIVIGNDVTETWLPNPSVDHIVPEDDRVYSDIHIH